MAIEGLEPAPPRSPRELPAAEVRAVRDELLHRARAAPATAPLLPGEVAGAWLIEYRSVNTRAAYAADIARFLVWCSARSIDVLALRRDQLAAYLDEPRPDGRPFAPKTLERRLSAIAGFYDYAIDLGLVDRHPRGQRKPLSIKARQPKRASSLSRPELERLIAAAADHSPNALAVVLLLGLYGLRVSEVCSLQVDQIDWDLGQPVLRVAGKGRAENESVAFPLPHDVLRPLRAAIGDRSEGVLLLKGTGRGYVRQEIDAFLRRLCRRADIQTQLSPHGLRATFVTLALNEGVPLRDVQDAARHADPRTTRQYDRDAGALNRHPVHRLVPALSA